MAPIPTQSCFFFFFFSKNSICPGQGHYLLIHSFLIYLVLVREIYIYINICIFIGWSIQKKRLHARVLYICKMKRSALIVWLLYLEEIYVYDLTCSNFTLQRQYVRLRVKAIEDTETMKIKDTLLMFWSWNFFLCPATAWPNEDLKL